ncbi:response regulator [Pleurocapsales cyanobacterium LEGE 06147]|nr:response regulator [Pleurocapsales cyanobacterium LEGE 06147]
METTLKILVVDDDEVDRMTVRRALKKAGLSAELTEAEDGAEAIAHLQGHMFDTVLLDYRLPDWDGLSIIRQIHELNIKVPLIVFTGQGDEEIAVEIMKAGAADYLSKTRISSETLPKAIRNAVRIHQAEMAATLATQRLRATNELLVLQNKELERQQQQIRLQNLQLQEAYRLKSQFLATMSHELRTPMNAIVGFSQLLLRQYPHPLTSEQVDIVQRIFNNSQNLLNMINEILDFSKIEAGKFELNFHEFDLAQLVKLTAEELRSLALQKKIALEVDIALTNTKVVQDLNSLKRVIINLLSNAIKFTEEGQVRIEVWEVNSERVGIAVKDTGIGISPEHLETIFQAFRQVDQSITRKYAGTGLGLAITDSLVKMMHGKIEVESQVGVGSVFRIEIPRKANA